MMAVPEPWLILLCRIAPCAMQLGSEILLASNRLDGLRVGVLANPTSTMEGTGTSSICSPPLPTSSSRRSSARSTGFRSDLQDNMIETPHADDPKRGVPIFSLYSETREPTAGHALWLIDVLVIDIQDVGVRIYTFIYTMANCLTPRARGAGVPVIVCDRPNPIGGIAVEGPILSSWATNRGVGQDTIPMRHGMTTAELARVLQRGVRPGRPSLSSCRCRGWSARDVFRRDRRTLDHALPQYADA